MTALAPPPAPGNRHTAKRIAGQMYTEANISVAAARVANIMFATAVQEVRATTDR